MNTAVILEANSTPTQTQMTVKGAVIPFSWTLIKVLDLERV